MFRLWAWWVTNYSIPQQDLFQQGTRLSLLPKHSVFQKKNIRRTRDHVVSCPFFYQSIPFFFWNKKKLTTFCLINYQRCWNKYSGIDLVSWNEPFLGFFSWSQKILWLVRNYRNYTSVFLKPHLERTILQTTPGILREEFFWNTPWTISSWRNHSCGAVPFLLAVLEEKNPRKQVNKKTKSC